MARKGSLWNPIVWYKGHHRRHLRLLDSLPPDIIKNQITDFLGLEDSLNFFKAFPDLGSGITPDQLSLLSLLKKWNRKKRLLKSDKFNSLYAKIDPSFQNDYLFRWAAATGWTELAKLLSKDHRVNIHSIDNWAYILARENDHSEILQLFQEMDPEMLVSNPNHSSLRILRDILESNFDSISQILESINDLQLLLETSLRLKESAVVAICLAIQSGNQEYIKILLEYFVFGKSYPWGSKITKVDPFIAHPKSIFIEAIRRRNLEIANLILDKSLWINPLTGFWSKTFRERRRILERAVGELRQFDFISAEALGLWNRIYYIMHCQILWSWMKILAITIPMGFLSWIE